MSALIVPDYEQLAARLEIERARGRTIVLTNGCFDLLHVGHVRLIQAAASEGDLLVVALNSDESVRANKGAGRPVVRLEDRMEIVAALVGVDFVTSFGDPTAHSLLETLRPDVHAKGTDWKVDEVPERAVVLGYGGRIAICGGPKQNSSSEILRRMGAES